MNAVTETVLAGLQDIVDISKAVPDPKYPEITILDAEHDISFGVYGNEIIVFFFEDHHHFYGNWDENYVQSAADMLRQLFSLPLLKQETFKGKKCIRREWFYLLEDGRKESIAGPWFLGGSFVNPFGKKSTKRTMWRYLRQAGHFIECPEDTVSVVEYAWDVAITLRKFGEGYTYDLERYFFDEETTYFCWLPVDTQGRSFFDTEESALCAAKEDARLYCKANPDRSLFLEDARKEVINDGKEQ